MCEHKFKIFYKVLNKHIFSYEEINITEKEIKNIVYIYKNALYVVVLLIMSEILFE